MSGKSGTSEQTLSLPKGGGAIKGIGETFQPNLFSGTGNFNIPIFTSPGRGGFGPQLTLQYSTGNGNGPFGLGWSLSIPRITRKTENGLPEYTDEDVFVMSGAEDLVVVDKQIIEPEVQLELKYEITRYLPRTEGLFARIEKWVELGENNSAHNIYWRATTKENITSIYGKTTQARIFNPDNHDQIYEWLLEETFDAKGNHILYEYAKEDQALDLNHIYENNRNYESQRYIRRILYGNTPKSLPDYKKTGPYREGTNHLDHSESTTVPIGRHYLFEVVFDYSTSPLLSQLEIPKSIKDSPFRQDPFSSFRSGFEIRTLRRCERVLMFHHFKELDTTPTLVKSTNFTYSNDPNTKLSILSSATITGHIKKGDGDLKEDSDIYTSASMPPVTFKYSEFTPHKQKYQSVTARGGNMPPISLKDPQTTLVDLRGDGFPDVLNTTNAGYYVWENMGNGHLDMRHSQQSIPAGITLAQPGVAFGDMGGDGMADLIVQRPEMAGFYEATPGGWKPFKKFRTYPSFSLADPNVRLIDLTGDGRSDILMTRDMQFLWFECLGEEGYGEPRAVTRNHNLDEFPNVYFNDPSARVRLADMTGDGLNDIVLLHNGRIDYWPNLGYGKFGKRITMKASPRLEYNFDPARLYLADIDGSGCVDLVYVDTGRVHFWFNQSGNSWSEEQVIHGTPPVTDFDSVQFADIFGTGTATLVWSYDLGRYPGKNYKALDFCGGKKPYVLNEMSNNMGATTKVQYAPSTKFYLEDKKNNTPWATNLPFPVHVVEKVEVIDHISKTKLVTTYKYHHGYYDGKEREFRGFGRVDQFDTEIFDDFSSPGLLGNDHPFTNNEQAFHVPPVETRSWFHTGVYFDEDKPDKDGKPFDHHKLMEVYKQEFYAGDAKAFPMENPIFQAYDPDEPLGAHHEIFRALRGAMLRKEIYARDGSEKETHPYAVTQNSYMVKQLHPKGSNLHAVYLTTPKESISYHYERNPEDPRVGHDITLGVDEFGNITDKISIGYPRRNVLQDPSDLPEQRKLKMLYTKADFINKPNETDFYYVGVPCETQVFEVTRGTWKWGNPKFSATYFKDLLTDNAFRPYEWQQPGGNDENDDVEKRLVEWSRSYFRKDTSAAKIDPVTPVDSNNPLPNRLKFGEIESLALPYETYQAVFSSIEILGKQLKDGEDTDENRFRIKFGINTDLLNEGGYHYDQDIPEYWWIPSGRQSFNKDKFYLPEESQDPFGSKSSIKYDQYALLMEKKIDPLNNVIEAINNFRVLQPYAVKDQNLNYTAARFDALGLVVATAVMGKLQANGTVEGDYLDLEKYEEQTETTSSPDKPTTKLEYDLFRWMNSKKPNFVKTLARERHKDDSSPWQESYLYSDGFGREVQIKVQAEAGLVDGENCNNRWVGTGRKIYNNKGKPVKQYEPFFSTTNEYEDEAKVGETGVTPIIFYDPLERVICTVHPNHTYEKIVFCPWQQETWDVNDTLYPTCGPVFEEFGDNTTPFFNPADDMDVGNYIRHLEEHHYLPAWFEQRVNSSISEESWPGVENKIIRTAERDAAQKALKHAATPTKTYLDSLGRPFLTVADNGKDENGNTQQIKTKVKLDVQGNDLEIIDPRKITVFKHRFDIAGRKIFINSVDAGRSANIHDIDGNPITTQDANGNVTTVKYDALRWPKQIIVDRAALHNAQITSQFIVYGESLSEETAIQQNLRGQIYAVFDGAGAVFNLNYDFKGNLLQSIRRLTKAFKADAINWDDIPTLDFSKSLSVLNLDLAQRLEEETFFTSTSYDALDRITESTAPDHSLFTTETADIPTDGSKYTYGYNKASLLETVTVYLNPQTDSPITNSHGDKQIFVSNINYNARGQREEITYGNEVVTTYHYDHNTYRLVDLVSKKNNGRGSTVQSLHYTYDPAGNITKIHDAVFSAVFNRNGKIKPENYYTYDPTYRLIEATGREHQAMSACHYSKGSKKQTEFVGLPVQPVSDSNAIGNYTEKYQYDLSGNITTFDHINHTYNYHWKRDQTYADDSNRLFSCGAKKQEYCQWPK